MHNDYNYIHSVAVRRIYTVHYDIGGNTVYNNKYYSDVICVGCRRRQRQLMTLRHFSIVYIKRLTRR